MENSTQSGVDDHLSPIFSGYSICASRALLSVLGAKEAGAQRRILVLPNRRCNFDCGVVGSEKIRFVR